VTKEILFAVFLGFSRSRPPRRISGGNPSVVPAAALSSSLAPLEPPCFDPRLLDKQALCVSNGISRGASLVRYVSPPPISCSTLWVYFCGHRLLQEVSPSVGITQIVYAFQKRKTVENGEFQSIPEIRLEVSLRTCDLNELPWERHWCHLRIQNLV